MRILFVAAPMQGHLLPLIPLARACRDAGHEVHVASGGFPVDMAGLTTHDIGGRFSLPRSVLRVALGRPAIALAEMQGRAGLGMVGELFGRANLSLVEPLTEVARQVRPDLIVYESLSEAGAVVAGWMDVPSVLQENTLWSATQLFTAVTTSSAMRARTIPAPELTITVTPPSMAALRPAPSAVGRPGSSAAGRAGSSDPGAKLASTGPGAKLANSVLRPMRPVPFSGGGDVPLWLLSEGERPRVLVSRSTLKGPNDGDPGPAVVAAAGDVDAEFVLVRPAGTARELPPNVRAVDRIPLDQALPYAAAFVHHSGAGSVLGGLAVGVPQLVTPGAGDRRHNAELLAKRGAGLAVEAKAITAADLTELLTAEALRAAAQEVRAEIAAMPAPEALVSELEKLVSG